MATEEHGDLLRKLESSLDRRDFLKLLSALGLTAGAGPLLAGCQSTPSAPAPAATGAPAAQAPAQPAATAGAVAAPAGTPKRGGTLKIPVTADVNPWPPIGLIQNLIVNKSIFNGLVRYSPADWTPQPDLAEKWEISKDGLTWTFYLRKGVSWHDGKPFTADDVKWSLEMYADEKVNSILRGNLAPINKIEVVDPTTVKVSTKEPYSALIELLGYLTFMLPKHLLEGQKFDPSTFPQDFIKKPIGTGPFKFQENVPGDHVTVIANESYHEGRPYLDSVIFKIVRDLNSTVAQVKTGELDLAFPTVAQLAALQGAPNLNIIERGVPEFRFFGMNYKHPQFGKWFSDKKVRQALAYAINSEGIMQQVAQGKAQRSNGPIAPAFKSWYVKEAPTFAYDPAKAKQMLADLGFKPGSDGILAKDGQKFAFTFFVDQGQPERQQTSLIVQQNLKDIGMDVQLEALEFNDFMKRERVTKEFTAVCFYYMMPTTPALHSYWSTGGSTNEWGYSNPEVDQLFKDGLKEFDDAKRHEIYKKAYTMLADEQPVIFLYHPNELQAINKRVKGFAKTHYRDALVYLNKVWIEG